MAEKYVDFLETALNGAMNTSQTTMTVDAIPAAAVSGRTATVVIDPGEVTEEFVRVTFPPSGLTLTVVRSSSPAAHADNAVVRFGAINAASLEQGFTDALAAAAAAVVDEIGTSIQAHAAVLDETTASFTTAHNDKLNNIDVTQPVDLDALETAMDAVLSDIDTLTADVGTANGNASAALTIANGAATDAGDALTAVAGKADAVHTHEISDTTGLQAALDAKAASTHTHAISDTTGLQDALDAKLDAGSVVETIGGVSGELTLQSGVFAMSGSELQLIANFASEFVIGDLETSSISMTVGAITYVDLNGVSADVTLTFPTTLAVNDRFAALVNREKANNAWGVKFADNGHTFNGSASDVESLFICYTGELIVFRVVKAPGQSSGGDNTVIVEYRSPVNGPLFTTYMDSDDAGFTAIASLTGTGGGYGGDQKFSNASGDHGKWSFENCPPGRYRVWACWSTDGNRDPSTTYRIEAPNTASETFTVNQQVAANDGTFRGFNAETVGWRELTDTFMCRGRGTIDVYSRQGTAGYYIISDGIRLQRIGALDK